MSAYPNPATVSAMTLESISVEGIILQSWFPERDSAIALDVLGGGVEHLVSSRLYTEAAATGAEREAIRILHRLRREVFEEYASSTGRAFHAA